MFIFITYHQSLKIMVSTTQTLPQVKSQVFMGNIQNYFTTSSLTYNTNVIQDFVMLFGGLEPVVLEGDVYFKIR